MDPLISLSFFLQFFPVSKVKSWSPIAGPVNPSLTNGCVHQQQQPPRSQTASNPTASNSTGSAVHTINSSVGTHVWFRTFFEWKLKKLRYLSDETKNSMSSKKLFEKVTGNRKSYRKYYPQKMGMRWNRASLLIRT